jgi:hypothetical protein
MKWLWVAILVVVGAIAAYVSIEYLTVGFHHLPSYLGHHKGKGHYRKRGVVAAVVAILALVGAGYLTYRNLRTAGPEPTGSPSDSSGTSTGEMLSDPSSPSAS